MRAYDLWTRTMPQALFDTLEGFSPQCAIVAAEAFLKQFGWKIERPGDETRADAVHEALTGLVDEVEKLYHRAPRESDLPHEPGVYAANMPDSQRWSCPYHPNEIAEHIRSKIDGIVEIAVNPAR
nr:hypothetical protein [Bradyrhizobium sp. 2S1]MCK7671482.1 hypothetical protein [Bradyrhizobium sp. 2S1]